jgi:acyl-CoA reductase-like NAD-dependent aldehyde dehydrogenase
MPRLPVTKTYKLFIDGKFPRSESGRTTAIPVESAPGGVPVHIARASRKDLRDAVTAARKALPGWSGATPCLRAQILYRAAEMLEARRAEFIEVLSEPPAHAGRYPRKRTGRGDEPEARARTPTPRARAAHKPPSRNTLPPPTPSDQLSASIDRLIAFAGWADKFAQVLGCNNPVAGPYYNFTIPEPSGVVAILAPDQPALLGLISLIAPVLCAGNTTVALGGDSPAASIAAAVLGELCATSDIPPGVVNLLTGTREELIPIFASHRDIDAIHAAGVTDAQRQTLREGAAENLKRVTVRGGMAVALHSHDSSPASHTRDPDWYDTTTCHSPWWIEPFVEFKTIWHPSAM